MLGGPLWRNVDVMWNIVEERGWFVDLIWNIGEECGCLWLLCGTLWRNVDVLWRNVDVMWSLYISTFHNLTKSSPLLGQSS